MITQKNLHTPAFKNYIIVSNNEAERAGTILGGNNTLLSNPVKDGVNTYFNCKDEEDKKNDADLSKEGIPCDVVNRHHSYLQRMLNNISIKERGQI